jgi:hypothetical protein
MPESNLPRNKRTPKTRAEKLEAIRVYTMERYYKRKAAGLCPQCGREKDTVSGFYCVLCRTKKSAAWRPTDKKKWKPRKLLRAHPDRKDVCGSCRNPPPPGQHLFIDHCHLSGRVRGFLCNSCNAGLGFFYDDPNRLKLAIKYLARWAQADLDFEDQEIYKKWRYLPATI